MPPVVAVVGNSNSGKTRIAASLIAALVERGYRVAAIKHCPHGHSLDRSRTDTGRLYRAGAATVIATSPHKRTRVDRADGDASLESVAATLGARVDMVIAEGFKTSAVPKVLVVSGGHPPPSVENVVATVSDGLDVENVGDVPAYGFEEVDGLASQLIAQIFEAGRPAPAVSLAVDGKPVPIIPFPGAILAGIVRGFLSTLKGIPEDPEEVQITIQRGAGAAVSIVADRMPVPLAAFPGAILSDVVRGFLSNLKGLPEDPEEVQITIQMRPSAADGPPPPGSTPK